MTLHDLIITLCLSGSLRRYPWFNKQQVIANEDDADSEEEREENKKELASLWENEDKGAV